MKTEFATEAMKGTPAVAGAFAAALTLNEVIAIATGIYIAVQAAYLLRKWWREEQEFVAQTRRDEAKDRRDAAMDRRDAAADRIEAQQPDRMGAADTRQHALDADQQEKRL